MSILVLPSLLLTIIVRKVYRKHFPAEKSQPGICLFIILPIDWVCA